MSRSLRFLPLVLCLCAASATAQMNGASSDSTARKLRVTEAMLASPFPQAVILPLQNAQRSVVHYVNWQYQLQQNLNADIYSGYMMTPTPFSVGCRPSMPITLRTSGTHIAGSQTVR